VPFSATDGRQLSRLPRRAGHKKSGKKSVLIMMSNTGGGHKASAEALQQAFKELYGDEYEVRRRGLAAARWRRW
jgi:hypothetical protein